MAEPTQALTTIKISLNQQQGSIPAKASNDNNDLNPEALGKILAGMDPVGDRKLTLTKISEYFNKDHDAMPLDLFKELFEAKKDTDVGAIIAAEAVKYKPDLKEQLDYAVAAFKQYNKSIQENNKTGTKDITSI